MTRFDHKSEKPHDEVKGTAGALVAGITRALCAHAEPAQSVAACRSKPGWRILALMSTKSRERIYGSSVRHSAERAAEARVGADRLACVAWNQRMLGFKGPAQPSPSLGDALNARYLYLEVRCLGCDTHQTVALNIVRRCAAR
jgi:hypothetical protein